jgi:hypothetical protein
MLLLAQDRHGTAERGEHDNPDDETTHHCSPESLSADPARMAHGHA